MYLLIKLYRFRCNTLYSTTKLLQVLFKRIYQGYAYKEEKEFSKNMKISVDLNSVFAIIFIRREKSDTPGGAGM